MPKDLYIILQNHNPTYLVESVNKAMADGYQPLGSPFFGDRLIYQALLLKPSPSLQLKIPFDQARSQGDQEL